MQTVEMDMSERAIARVSATRDGREKDVDVVDLSTLDVQLDLPWIQPPVSVSARQILPLQNVVPELTTVKNAIPLRDVTGVKANVSCLI